MPLICLSLADSLTNYTAREAALESFARHHEKDHLKVS